MTLSSYPSQAVDFCISHCVDNAFAPIQDPYNPKDWAAQPPHQEEEIEVSLWNLLEDQPKTVHRQIKKQLLPWFLYTSSQRSYILDKMMYVEELTPANSSNLALFGQKGVFSRYDIPAFTVLGPYAGRLIKDSALVDRELRLFPDYQLQRYLFSCSKEGGFPYISGFGSGNIITLINDCRPASQNMPVESNLSWFEMQNCCSIIIKTQTLSGVFYVSTKSIPKGSEILVDYGDGFWS
jgi:hypothetical protein